MEEDCEFVMIDLKLSFMLASGMQEVNIQDICQAMIGADR